MSTVKLTYAEWLRESSLGQEEYRRGDYRVAFARFAKLIARIEAQSEGEAMGRGSDVHFKTLALLARILDADGFRIEAQSRIFEALGIVNSLIKQCPDAEIRRSYIVEQAHLLGDLGGILLMQGEYEKAKTAFEEQYQIAVQQNDLQLLGSALGNLARLAHKQHDYGKARMYYEESLKSISLMGEPRMEAIEWHQLGLIAFESQDWQEAEECNRKSLELWEQLHNEEGVADTCNELATIAIAAGRLAEADGWLSRAIEIIARIRPGSIPHLGYLDNLSTVLEILAENSDKEGHPQEAQTYRRRERETYAANPRNRARVNRKQGKLIRSIVAAVRGNVQTRTRLIATLPQSHIQLKLAINRIWTGERDWHTLASNLQRDDALLILRVLEVLENPPRYHTLAEAQVLLPEAIRIAMAKNDRLAFANAIEALSFKEKIATDEILAFLESSDDETL